jgi:hypothetical protein
MRNYINIKGNNQVFPYLFEYNPEKAAQVTDNVINWCNDNGVIRLHESDVKYYRDYNEWYSTDNITNYSNIYIPETTGLSKITVYIPAHPISTYAKGIKYVVTANTWLNGNKIDLGSFMFKPSDTYAAERLIKNGNNEYYECIEFDVIDPFDLLYSNRWQEFRVNVCKENAGTNTACSYLTLSMFIVNEYENKYFVSNDWLGGCTSFSVSNLTDYLSLHLTTNYEPLGFGFGLKYNNVYTGQYSLMDYLKETYFFDNSSTQPTLLKTNQIAFELVIKNKNSVIIGPQMIYCADPSVNRFALEDKRPENFSYYQVMSYENICGSNGNAPLRPISPSLGYVPSIPEFFKNWNAFEEGWSLVGSMIIYDDSILYPDENYDNSPMNNTNIANEIFSITSNEVPITQELFRLFVNGGEKTEKIIDINDMNINTYNVVNKIENKIVKIERQSDSKSNIIQPVFFRTNELEKLTIHPNVTENISINLDSFKSKVKKFTLQIDNNKFEQIGANTYGILFKIPANTISANVTTGVYYILDENLELVTTGKYNCVR